MVIDQNVSNVLVTLIQAGSAIVIALLGYLIKKGSDYVDKKTQFLDASKKATLFAHIHSAAESAVNATYQTYVNGIKAGTENDGKLSHDEAKEALGKALDSGMTLLKSTGIEIGREALQIAVESVICAGKKKSLLASSPAGQ